MVVVWSSIIITISSSTITRSSSSMHNVGVTRSDMIMVATTTWEEVMTTTRIITISPKVMFSIKILFKGERTMLPSPSFIANRAHGMMAATPIMLERNISILFKSNESMRNVLNHQWIDQKCRLLAK